MSHYHDPAGQLLGFTRLAMRVLGVANACLLASALYFVDNSDDVADAELAWQGGILFGLGIALAIIGGLARRWRRRHGGLKWEKTAIATGIGAVAMFLLGSFVCIYAVAALA
jgi:hypothetical protein